MRWLHIVVGSVGLWVGACEPRLPELDEIEGYQRDLRKLVNSEGAQSSAFMTTALKLARAEEAFARKYPNHPDVPKLLIEAAEIHATYFGDPSRAVEILRGIDLRFRQRSDLAPKALFYEAFLYENALADTAKARERYEAFLRYYPGHELAKDARLSLQNLGKTPDQLLKELLREQ
ncbi:MAG: hypothetical protein N2170_07255 [Bacteroidia bacterium]|nr:hypothetical protein [Bacteroidia bacterium]